MANKKVPKAKSTRNLGGGKGLRDYIKHYNFEKDYHFTNSGEIFFHWANWNESCKVQQKLLQTEEGVVRLKKFEGYFRGLLESTIWIQNRGECTCFKLYDLYEAFLDARLRLLWFENQERALVSLAHQSGPYVPINSMRWFDKDIYALFIYRKILLEGSRMREFRLGMNIPIFCYFNGSSVITAEAILHQVSENGILIKMEGGHIPLKMSMSDYMEMHLDLSPFIRGKGKKISHLVNEVSLHSFMPEKKDHTSIFKVSSNIFEKYGNCYNMKCSNNMDFYVFIPYKDMIEDGGTRVSDTMKKTVGNFKFHIQSELKNVA